MIVSVFELFIGTLFCCSLLISVNGKTYKSAINRPIKIRTHHVVQKHTMHTDRLTNVRQAVRADNQLDEGSDGQTGRFEQIRYPQANSTFKLVWEWESNKEYLVIWFIYQKWFNYSREIDLVWPLFPIQTNSFNNVHTLTWKCPIPLYEG